MRCKNEMSGGLSIRWIIAVAIFMVPCLGACAACHNDGDHGGSDENSAPPVVDDDDDSAASSDDISEDDGGDDSADSDDSLDDDSGDDDSGDDDSVDDDSEDDDSATADDSADDSAGDDDDTYPPPPRDLYEFAPPPSDDIGIFVATTGDDGNPGTMDAPKRTLTVAVAQALLDGKFVFAAAGEYFEEFRTNVSIFGGYEQLNWTRDIAANSTRVVIPQGHSVDLDAPVPEGPTTVIEGLTFPAEAVVSDTGEPVMSSTVHIGTGSIVLSQVDIESSASSGTATALYMVSPQLLVIASRIAIVPPAFGLGPTDSTAVVMGGSVVVLNSVVSAGGSGADGAISRAIEVMDGCRTTLVHCFVFGGVLTGAGTTSTGIYTHSWFYDPMFQAVVVDSIVDGGTGDVSDGMSLAAATMTRLLNTDIWGAAQDCPVRYESAWPWPRCADTTAEIAAIPQMAQATGVLLEDPQFTADVPHITFDSPCRNSGIDPTDEVLAFQSFFDFDLAPLALRDFEGDLRPYGSGWDIGPDEWTP